MLHINKNVIRFYSILILLYFSDMVLLLSNIWSSLRVTGSSIFLGVTLSIGIIVPFLLKRTGFISSYSVSDMRNLYNRRIFIFFILLIISIFKYSDTVIGFIINSISIGYLSFVTLSTLESANTKLVLHGYITSQLASRVMQTVVQIGSFFGAMACGFLLEIISFNFLIFIISVFDIIVSLFGKYIFYFDNQSYDIKNVRHDTHRKLRNILIYYSIYIGIVGIHIVAFNTLTPVIFQDVRGHSVEYFGLCSASAGLGAFLAAFLNIKLFHFLLPAITLMVSDYFFVMSANPRYAMVACFFIGISINTIRINARKQIIDQTIDDEEADRVSSFSAIIYTLSQAVGPIFFGTLTSKIVFGSSFAIYPLPIIGALLIVYSLLNFLYKGNNNA